MCALSLRPRELGTQDVLDDDPGDSGEKRCNYCEPSDPIRPGVATVSTEEGTDHGELDDLDENRRSYEKPGHFQRRPHADDTQGRHDQAAKSADSGSLPRS
jgi:hypothetical protein